MCLVPLSEHDSFCAIRIVGGSVVLVYLGLLTRFNSK